ncbi:VanZ family protein [Oceanobacillus sp. CAU 1775]
MIAKAIIFLSFIIYVTVLMYILFFDSRSLYIAKGVPFAQYLKFNSNFIPFKTIAIYVNALFDGSLNINIPIRNLVGNLLMFLPMGVYLPYYVKRVNKVSVFIIAMLILLLLVESFQMITGLGSFDIDDITLNLSGALIGYGIWKLKLVQKVLI